jgi:glycerol-1-phosphate dehydrogenase [NAD(P)+]
MLLFDALGSEVQRAYQTRAVDLPRAMFFGPDAAERLAAAIGDDTSGRCAAVLFDVRTRAAAGAPCVEALRRYGFVVTECLVPDRDGDSPVCDDQTHAWLSERVPPSDVLVAVGSGVINDLTKWLAVDAGVPYAAFATASSMNGYASANVAPKIDGVKSLIAGRAARVVAADPAVLAAAPHRLTTAGFGDLLAKPVSTADWILNHLLFDEPFSPSLASVVDRFEATVFAHPDALVRGEQAAVRSLFEALVLSGCTMTLHGSSLPASGGEHVISHSLDMMSDADGSAHDLHGRQVGVATVVAAALWERMMQLDAPRFEPVVPPMDPSVWGPAAGAVARQHEAKQSAVAKAHEKLSRPGAWDALRTRVSPHLIAPSVLRDRLRLADGAWTLSHIGCSRARFLTALRHGGAMRGRFTSVDLAHMVGVLPDDALVDSWVM